MRIKVRMKKLTKPEAQFVSLVRRSANQIPFRIQKADNEGTMLDLTSIPRMLRLGAKVKKTAPIEPKVSGIVVNKTGDLEKIKETISKAGFSTDSPIENADGTILFAQDDSPEEGALPVRVGPHMILVVKGISEEPLKGYSTQLGAEGYVDDMVSGAMALGPLFASMVNSADSQEDFKAKVTKAMEDFSSFVTGLVDAIPVSVYKVSDSVQQIQKAAAEVAAKGAPVADEKKEKKDEPKTEPVVKADETKKDEPKTEPKVDDTLTKILAAVDGLSKSVNEVVTVQKAQGEKIEAATKAAEAVTKTTEELKTQVLEVATKTEAQEKILKGAVISAPPPGDSPPKKEPVKKAEDDMGDGYWDSALARRQAKQSH